MSGKTSWLRKKKPGLVASTTSAMNPAWAPERRRPMANTPSNVASAAAIEGIGASRSDTRPVGQAPSATVQKNNGGLLRYGASRTRAGSRGPWRSACPPRARPLEPRPGSKEGECRWASCTRSRPRSARPRAVPADGPSTLRVSPATGVLLRTGFRVQHLGPMGIILVLAAARAAAHPRVFRPGGRIWR